ncbi:MAG: hydantoinase/oxoprolinase family protein, partial [Planctomycetota bacterium]
MVPLRAGVDTGGTFTDAVSPEEGGWKVCKVATTPRQPARAVLRALRSLLPGRRGPLELVHGTTHATNALLTGRLGRTVFVTTRGFADVLAIGRQDRPVLYALEPRPRRPFQPRSRIVEVRERVGPDGKASLALSREEIARVAAAVERLRPQAVAVAFLHAYRFPGHEERMGRALKRLGVPVVLSSGIAPEHREFERFSTAWADAGLSPVTGPALSALDGALRREWGPGSRLRILRSDGGTCDASAAAVHPVHLLLSGPAGGLSAARTLADARGDRDFLTLDMGGTSTDVSLLGAGELSLLPLDLGGLSFLCRALPLHSVGTGGGSLARWDAGGALAVGPESAGAVPGPACYGRGGEGVTVTDAHLL